MTNKVKVKVEDIRNLDSEELEQKGKEYLENEFKFVLSQGHTVEELADIVSRLSMTCATQVEIINSYTKIIEHIVDGELRSD